MSKVRVINGDCLDPNIVKIFPNDLDIIFTSPPYNIGSNNFHKYTNAREGDKPKYKGDENKDKKINWLDWIEEVILTYLDKAKYFFLNVQKLSANNKQINELLFRLNNYYCDEIVWNKGHGVPNGFNERVMTNCVEMIYVFSKQGKGRNGTGRAVGTKPWKGNVGNVINLKGNQRNPYSKIHKALFPLHLPEYIFSNFVKENGKVADIMMGLGTSAIAAKKLNLDFYGVELDQEFYNIAKGRIKNEK